MKIYIYLLVISLCSISVLATPLGDIRAKAKELGSPVEIIKYVDQLNYTQKYYNGLHSRGILWSYYNQEWDCTEMAETECYMIKSLKIPCREVQGYADGNKHNWVEWQVNGTWINHESKYFDTLIKTRNNR